MLEWLKHMWVWLVGIVLGALMIIAFIPLSTLLMLVCLGFTAHNTYTLYKLKKRSE